MPIGFDRGDVGGRTPAQDQPPELERWAWLEIVARPLVAVVWTRWRTQADERVCPECGPLDGLVWEAGAGPAPPLHVNCRCVRGYAFTEWRVRDWGRGR